MKVIVLHTAVDWQSTVTAGCTDSSKVVVHVHKAGSSRTHHRHVTAVLSVVFIHPLFNSFIQGPPERTHGFHRQKNVLKLQQIKLLLVPSNSQVNAVYLCNTTSSMWCPWVFIQELKHLLKFLITLKVIAGVICWISFWIAIFSSTRLRGQCLYTSPSK